MTSFDKAKVGERAFDASDAWNCVEVCVPARPEMWGLPRMAVSTVASLQGFDIEYIEDLRISVDELCTLCAAGSGVHTTLRVVVRCDDDLVVVSCRATGLASDGEDAPDPDLPPGFTPSELSHRILEALVDEYNVSVAENGARQGWFLKSK